MHSSVMISPAKRSPPAVERYLQTKIRMIDSETIKSSPQAQTKICHFRKHNNGTCKACSLLKQKIKEDDDHHYGKRQEASDSD